MAEYYKYVQRDADSNINWAEVGKSLSDVLLETNRVREEKKTAIDQSIRESLNNLANSPQGINQDVNNFLNNYTSDMSAQILLDKKLLQSGQMDLKDWTLRQQNYKDGTDQMFNLSRTYQEKSKEIMDGIDNNEIQSALGLYNMGTIEGFTNFNNSRATINSVGDGKVSLALYENKIIDGKEVRVLSKNNMPVNVLLGQIHNQPKKFDVEGTTAATAKAFGTRFQAVYKAASTVGAGTITELLGIETMKKYPQFKGIVDEMNKAINDQVDSNLSNPLNVISVLGENTGNYSSESFTYDKDEAAKDPKKILLTIDPRTQTATMDENAPHYKKQYEEAAAWVKTSLMSKLDSEAKISTTGQLSDQTYRPSAADKQAKSLENESITFGQMAADATTSNNLAVKSQAIRYLDAKLQGTDYRLLNNPKGFGKGLYIYNNKNPEQSINLTKENSPDRAFKAVVSGINSILQQTEIGGYYEDKAVNAGMKRLGKQVSRLSTGKTRENISKKTYKTAAGATGELD